MGVILVILCFTTVQIFTTVSGAVTLPFTDLVATVVPKKPSPSLTENSSSLPRVSESNNVLEYYKAQYPDSAASIVCEYSSPLVLTTSSRGLPVPNVVDSSKTINKQTTIAGSNIEEANPFKTSPLLKDSKVNTPDISLPKVSSKSSVPNLSASTVSTKISAPKLSSPLVTSSSLPIVPYKGFTPLSFGNLIDPTPNVNDKLLSLLRSISSLPSVHTESLQRSLDSVVEISKVKNNFLSSSTYSKVPLSPLYSVPYPLKYNLLSLPNVVVPNNNPVRERSFTENPFLINSKQPILTPKPYIAPIKVPSAMQFRPKTPYLNFDSSQYECCRKILNQERSLKKDNPPSSPKPQNFHTILNCHLNENDDYTNDLKIPNGLTTSDSRLSRDLEKDLVNQQPINNPYLQKARNVFDQEISTQYFEPNLVTNTLVNILPANPLLQNREETLVNPLLPPKISSPPKGPQVPTIPATYIKVSPTNSVSKSCSKMVSSINDILSNITEDILISYLTPKSSFKANNYQNIPPTGYTLRRKPKRVRKQKKNRRSKNKFNRNSNVKPPIVAESTNSPMCLSNNPSIAPTYVSIEPPFSYSDSSSFMTSSSAHSSPFINEYSPSYFTSYTPVTNSLIPVKVSVLPQTSLTDYIPPQPCPTYLPSPVIPTYIDTMPIVMEPHVVMADKKSNSVERLVQLIFLGELLKSGDSVDLNALDGMLALLCAS